MNDTFDYVIGTEKIRPIDGFYQYSAKLRWLVRNSGSNAKVVSYAEHHIGNEYWGETAQDAYNKVDIAVRRWIERQTN
jgi:hypothetical protein